nr:S8 family serine peptidase [Clostridioides sp.]
MWYGSSRGPTMGASTKPDFVAPGVNIISTYGNNSYRTGTGTGISSSIISGMLALLMEYVSKQGRYPKLVMYSEVLKSYLMIGATRSELYKYPNSSQGYGVVNFKRTIQIISYSL